MTRDFRHVKVGDTVTRMLVGTIPMPLRVTDVTETLIVCGGWTFDRRTGIEVDDELGIPISFLKGGGRMVTT